MAKIISIHSFRGGTGKSNTTANLSALLALQGKRVCVIDTDIQSPGIHVLFGLDGDKVSTSLNDFLWHGRAIEDVAIDVTPPAVQEKAGKIYLIPSSIKPGEITRVMREGYDTRQLTEGFRRLLTQLNSDYLLIGCPSRIRRRDLAFTGDIQYPVVGQQSPTLRTAIPMLQFARARMGLFADHGPALLAA